MFGEHFKIHSPNISFPVQASQKVVTKMHDECWTYAQIASPTTLSRGVLLIIAEGCRRVGCSVVGHT